MQNEKLPLTTPPEGIYGDSGPSLSPDTKILAFTRHSLWGRSDLYLLPLGPDFRPSGEPKLLKTDVPNANCAVWTPDGKWIYFYSNRGGQTRVWKIAPDGRFLLYTQSDRETDDLMLVENFR